MKGSSVWMIARASHMIRPLAEFCNHEEFKIARKAKHKRVRIYIDTSLCEGAKDWMKQYGDKQEKSV